MFFGIRMRIEATRLRRSPRLRRRRAQTMLSWYVSEMDQLRSDFAHLPGDRDLDDEIIKLATQHVKNLGVLEERICGLADLYRFLGACRDIPATRTINRISGLDTQVFEITEDMLDMLLQLQLTLTRYLMVLRQHELDCPDGCIESAAKMVARVLSPREWREAGHEAPNLQDGLGIGISSYLQAAAQS